MILFFKGFTAGLKGKAAVICLAVVMCLPTLVSAQADRQEEEEPVVETSTNAGPWGNSSGSSIGTNGNAITQGTARPADPNLSSANAAARPAAGPTPDATGGPGGNPDVPFDSNMNMLFLMAGIAFAYIMYRRKLKVKPLAIEN